LERYVSLRKLIDENSSFVIIPHINPDGDALGSCLGLMRILQSLGKSAKVVSPNGFPDFLDWLPGAGEIIRFDTNKELAINTLALAEVMFFLDFNTPSRLKEMASYVDSSTASRVMIDHHPDPEDVVDLMFSDISASSTCELVYHVVQGVGLAGKIDREAAEALYTGIITDTGGLSYNSSNPVTYNVVAALLKAGIDKPKIHENIFNCNTFGRMQLLGYSLSSKMVALPQQEAAYIFLSRDELNRFGYKDGDTEGFVNYPLSISNVFISGFFAEKDDKIKISFRSRGEFPVNAFSAKYFGGGGHKNAAGGEFKGTLKQAVEFFEESLSIFYQQWKNNLL
jgi:phosphoesterase RecJ-like protein